MKYKTYITITLLLVFTLNLQAQTNQDKAKAYFKQATTQFSQNQYADCITTLDKVEDLLGASNARVSSLKTKAYFNNKQYFKAKEELNLFFKYKSAENLKNEMLDYIVKIDTAVEKEQKAREAREEQERLATVAKEKERQRLAAIQEEKEEREALELQDKNAFESFLNNMNSIDEYEPEEIDGFINKLNTKKYQEEARYTFDCMGAKYRFDNKYYRFNSKTPNEGLDEFKKVVDQENFENKIVNEYREELKKYELGKQATVITIKDDGWSTDVSGSFYIRNCINVKEVNIEGDIGQESLNNYFYWLTSISGNISKLMIYIHDSIEYIPNSLGNFHKLEELRIVMYKTEPIKFKLPESLGNLAQLELLHLGWQSYTTASIELPQEFGDLQNLKVFSVEGTCGKFSNSSKNGSITKIPENIGNLKSLEKIEIHGFPAEDIKIPESITKLINLRTFKMTTPTKSYCGYPKERLKLPLQIGDLKNLKTLDIHWIIIENLPPSLVQLTKLNWYYNKYGIKHFKKIDKELTNELLDKGILIKE